MCVFQDVCFVCVCVCVYRFWLVEILTYSSSDVLYVCMDVYLVCVCVLGCFLNVLFVYV